MSAPALLPALPDLAALAPMDVTSRADRLRDAMVPLGLDALVVSHLVNVRYLTGFTGSAATLVVLPDDLVFITDGRYGGQSAAQLAAAGVPARIEVFTEAAKQKGIVQGALRGSRRIGLEAQHVSWAAQRRFAGDWFPGVHLVATEGLVEDLRTVKDAGELDRMAAAALIADHALAEVRGLLGEGPSEEEIGLALDTAMRRLGAAGPSFETIVASGPNGAMPHARPGPRRLGAGDLVVMDFGAIVDGYCSDMTRTFMVGEASETQQRMFDVVAHAQQAGVDAVREGVAASAVDAACREVIERAGWGDAFVHSTGHGVGLDIHEQPRVSKTADATLVPGQVVTVEPGVYLSDHGGVRIEDTVVVTAEGCRVLTLSPKDLALPGADDES